VAQTGQRIVGSGMGATTLKLLPTSGATRYAVGTNFASTELTGFELSDLTIDCNLPTNPQANTGAGAIRVRGKHIYLRRIKVKNYGAANGEIAIITAAGEASENCVIDDCTADPPATGHAGQATVYVFESTTDINKHHRFCAIRNCAVRGSGNFENSIPAISADSLRAIAPGTGLGTVIEGNQVVNCSVGVYSGATAKDMVFWNNYFRNVSIGFWFKNNTNAAIGRLVFIDNFVELATAANSLTDGDWKTGIRLNSTQSATQFKQLVLRKNLIRDVAEPSGVNASLRGINVQRCGELVAENNIIDNVSTDEAVRFANCQSRKFFNNQNTAGQLLRGFDGTNYVLELEDREEDVLLAM
jgi:hypothetical protein